MNKTLEIYHKLVKISKNKWNTNNGSRAFGYTHDKRCIIIYKSNFNKYMDLWYDFGTEKLEKYFIEWLKYEIPESKGFNILFCGDCLPKSRFKHKIKIK